MLSENYLVEIVPFCLYVDKCCTFAIPKNICSQREKAHKIHLQHSLKFTLQEDFWGKKIT